MLNVAFLSKTPALTEAFSAIPFWGEAAALVPLETRPDLDDLSDLVGEQPYDLLVVDHALLSEQTWAVLDEVRKEKDLPIALVGEKGNFELAREGILHQVSEYLTAPFSGEDLGALLERIRLPRLLQRKELPLEDLSKELRRQFFSGTEECLDLASVLLREGKFSQVADETVELLFDDCDWLDLYVKEETYLSDAAESQSAHYELFFELFDLWHRLYPPHGELLEPLFQYVLFNPESDLRQKNLSNELHINQSYLSTVFANQTGIRFVDYITRVKLARAAWLLLHTNLKVSEVAAHIGYKDTAYFSRQFKNTYLSTPSDYRLPDTYRLWI